ncbi:MAG: hypothetical protein ACYTBZ_31530 [Planctomycetota bacterium]|jgi:hypothetical protein
MGKDDHIYTSEFRTACRELEKKGYPRPGDEAMKRLGIEKSVKKKFHDYYLDKKLRMP